MFHPFVGLWVLWQAIPPPWEQDLCVQSEAKHVPGQRGTTADPQDSSCQNILT